MPSIKKCARDSPRRGPNSATTTASKVAIFTGSGRAFCASADMKESLERGTPGGVRRAIEDPFMSGVIEKPVIAAVNGYAMGGGFMLVERTDLRVAARGVVFEVSEAKRWLLGGYNLGHIANRPYPIAMEMALGFRFTAERFYEIGFLNRLVGADQLIPSALAMAEHLLILPPASRVNTVHVMHQMRPMPTSEQQRLAAALKEHGAKSDLIESRAAFTKKRAPQFKRLGGSARPLPSPDPPRSEQLARPRRRFTPEASERRIPRPRRRTRHPPATGTGSHSGQVPPTGFI
jgi:enoyl-CoA hydratase/carnithine racemase